MGARRRAPSPAILLAALPMACCGNSRRSGLHVGDGLPIPGGKYVLHQKANIPVPIHPGYAELLPELNGTMIITSFEATPFLGQSAVYVYDPAGAGLQKLPGSERIDWPNAAAAIGPSAFGFPVLVVGSGFLVPSHTNGGVWVMEASAQPGHLQAPVKVTRDKAGSLPDSGWFYHLAVPVDMNGDGLQDLLTARCQYGVWPWSRKQGELLWLQQPKAAPFSGEAWQEHHLADGPDFLFCVQPGNGTMALVASEFIGAKMVYYFMRNGTLQSRVLDANSGPGFSCSWADLNMDGRLELLATNHENKNGSVFAYSFDGDDFATAAVTRHVLATGFSAEKSRAGLASPGDAVAFKPAQNDQGKPHIFLSGDNSNSIFILAPDSQDAHDWGYSTTQIAYLGADVGRPAIGDTDGNGFADVYVPAYDQNVLVHYQFGELADAAAIVV